VQNLYKHIRTIHQRQVTRCDYCGSVFRNAESARKHVLKLHRNDLTLGHGLSSVEPAVVESGGDHLKPALTVPEVVVATVGSPPSSSSNPSQTFSISLEQLM